MDQQRYGVTPQSEKEGHGCFWWGCLTLIIVIVGAIVALFFGAKYALNKVVDTYTVTAPMDLPKMNLATADGERILANVKEFVDGVKRGETRAPLVLSGEELTAALIKQEPTLQDRVYLTVEDNKLRAQISFPLDSFGYEGRYINGWATFNGGLANDRLEVYLEDAEFNGKPLPEEILTRARNQNFGKDAYDKKENADFLKKLESIQLENGKVKITAKPSSAQT